ncbi:hypothetical protein BAUCODRAFT_245390 [Baudoinia panamericana UAMH 10762]|uniref:Uncharacterized protein n=1 Tax=Baudoinia panamericana (strain UAMH 10762) TaxID=717646 RepID=M2MAS0_BAUPA|nr:uncharacterized protein BAUCODRAFT_245390 [Baudoinia panamericana UAMH 10762]EMC93551.1 hypothetical protein BAUCODRAFT_245390 [Baudoinia panamericana UAMH 10762]
MPVGDAFTLGRTLIYAANLSYSLGAFAADYNKTHVYNPRWTPHAKFHNGQTMSLAAMLSSASCTLAYQSTGVEPDIATTLLWWAAVFGSFYCASGLSAILYPGTDWADEEYKRKDGLTQRPIFCTVIAVMWVGYLLEVRKY